nr:choice-of-anchor tandem repeat GloVer-containing protein [uncultured Fluviicola sp.]
MKPVFGIALLVFFLLSTSQTFAQYTKLFEFDYPTGSHPTASLIGDSTYLYGLTRDRSNIFRIKYDGTDFENLYFVSGSQGNTTCGSLYSDGLYLYGTAQFGGPHNGGSVFKIRKDGSDFSVVYGFGGMQGDGEQPTGSVISDGVYLYGLTGGYAAISYGTIFKVKKDGTDFSVLHTFASIPSDGEAPQGSLVSDGTYLYGMTRYGGTNDNGVIFRIKPDGSDYTLLKIFSNTTGAQPWGDLMFDGTYLYGMNSNYGPGGYGAVFKLKPDGTDYTVLRSFTSGNGPNGSEPHGSLILEGTTLYGMTRLGGHNYAEGNVFSIETDGTGYQDMYNFSDSDGDAPVGSLFLKDSNLYGMTYKGGAYHYGVIFKLNKDAKVTLGLSDLENEAVIRISPNPASDVLHVESGGLESNQEYELTNAIGEQVLIGVLGPDQLIPVSNLDWGVYFLKINHQSVKFIRN